jgi:biotin/methionine sulfoxide reductase
MPKFIQTATHWGTYSVRSEQGQIVEIRDSDLDPAPALIGGGMMDAIHHSTRVKRPSIRQGFLRDGIASERTARACEPFVEVPWDEALDIAAYHLDRVRKDHGNASIFGGSYGWASAGRFHHAQSQIHRFLNCLGGYTGSTDTYSYAAVSALMPHIVGKFSGLVLEEATSWDAIAGHCDLMVMFGGMALKNAQINAGGVGRHSLENWLGKARQSGTEFVSISPIKTDAPEVTQAQWISPLPNTDTALMLALAHCLHTEGLADNDFLNTYTTGFSEFLPYLLGTSDGCAKDADWAASICQIPSEEIKDLARRMAKGRTMITVAWALQRADHGEQPCWMAVVLAAMLGQIGLLGGGFGIGYGCANGIGNPTKSVRFPAVPQGANPVPDPIPVARISDALLSPNQPYRFNGADRIYPDLRLVYWAGGNPFHHQMELGRLVEAFHKPEVIIVNEVWWTSTARHADIVLPSTSSFERRDLSMVRWDPSISAMEPSIPPQGEARDDYDIFAGIADRFQLRDEFTQGRSVDDWLNALWDQAGEAAAAQGVELPSLDELRNKNVIERAVSKTPKILLSKFRNDPKQNPLSTPSGKIEIFSEVIDSWNDTKCKGHPVWLESYEWAGAKIAKTFPLHLISNQPATRLHSQMDCGSVSVASKIQGREPVTLHSKDAQSRGLVDGDIVRLFNNRGACLAGLIISDDVMPGVVQLATGAWYDPEEPGNPKSLCIHGNPNVLTRDIGTSTLGQGPTAHSTLVEVERFEKVLPKITVFDPPEFTCPDVA